MELRLAHRDEAAGLERVIAPNGGAVVYAVETPIVSHSDVERTSVMSDQFGKPSVGLTITRDAARRISRTFPDHVGKPVVWYIDGSPVAVHDIQDPHLGTNLAIQGAGWSQAEAAGIADGILAAREAGAGSQQ